MRKIISFAHISLDGFVAGPAREMNWIKVDEELFDHISDRIGQTNAALYGRVTYDMMEGYWPHAGKEPDASKHDRDHSQWYSTAHKIVLSNTLKEAELENTTVINESNLAEKINELKQQQGSEILLFGSPSATHALHRLNLVDGYWLFVNPIILGEGVPLFAGIAGRKNLKLIATRAFTRGVTELSFTVEK
ncbi:MAG: hypothetical protein JWP27_2406 [Flaviaesturariibacter sp.]|nr:hypothetical protein [Flaviaesturariibacter sp.]